MADVQTIVSLLNAPPLELPISLLEFSQKSPKQLRQVLVHVLSFISPNQLLQKKILESENVEASTACIMELLYALGYSPSMDVISFRQEMAMGTANVIYLILARLLPQLSTIKRNVYLSHFLGDVELPGELLMDEDVNILQAQCDSLREIFKGPVAFKEQVQKLQAEKQHLTAKISKLKAKLHNVGKLDQMLELVTHLRKEVLEDTSFIDSLKQHQEALSAATRKHAKSLLKLEYVQALAASPSQFIVEKVAQEILMLRYVSKAKLPKELEAKQRRFQALQNVLNDPNYGDDKVSRIQARLVAANNELKSLRKRSSFNRNDENVGVPSDAQMLQYQQCGIVAEKLKAAFETVAALTHRKEQLVVELSQKTRVIEEARGTVLRGEELKQFVDSLRGKTATYRTLKKEIDDMEAEIEVLKRTQELLQQQAPSSTMLENVCELESKDVDPDKTIEMLTGLINEVTASIKEHKQNLAPKIRMLEASRKAKQDLEIASSERKHHAMEVTTLYQRKVNTLEAEVEGLRRELATENKLFQEKFAAAQVVEASLDELSREEQGAVVSAGIRTKLQQQEDLKTTLEQRQQKLKDIEQYNHMQMTMMKDLLTILSAKLKQYSSASRPAIYSTVTTLETDEYQNDSHQAQVECSALAPGY